MSERNNYGDSIVGSTSGPIIPIADDSNTGNWIPKIEPLEEKQISRKEAAAIYETQTNFLKGKILTLVDAAFADKDQRKAVKDLVHQQFHVQLKHVYEIFTGNPMICAAGEKMPPS